MSRSSSSSSSSISSSRSSSSSLVSSSSSSEVRCCTCYYELNPQCDTRTVDTCVPKDCSDGKNNDVGDTKIDGEDPGCFTGPGWKDESEEDGYQPADCVVEGNRCVNLHYTQCRDEPLLKNCNQQRLLPKGTPIAYPTEWRCKQPTLDIEKGHEMPGVCRGFMDRAMCMVSCSTSDCMTIKNDGCGVLGNLPDVQKSVTKIQQLMVAKGLKSVVLIGNQTVATPSCETRAYITIREKTITTTFGSCNFGTQCYFSGETFKCSDPGAGGASASGICCRNPSNNRLEFVRDTFGGKCPNYCFFGSDCASATTTPTACVDNADGKTKRSYICCPGLGGGDALSRAEPGGGKCPTQKKSDTVMGYGIAPSCENAKQIAIDDANKQLERKRQKCVMTPGGNFTSTCMEPEYLSEVSTATECRYAADCDWTCTW